MEFDSCINLCNKTIEKIHESDLMKTYGPFLYNYKGLSKKRTGDFYGSRLNFMIGTNYACLTNETKILITLISNLSSLYLDTEKYNESIGILSYLKTNYSKHLDKDREAILMNNKAELLSSLQKDSEAFMLFTELLEFKDQQKVAGEYDSTTTFINYSRFLTRKDQFDKAKFYLLKAVESSLINYSPGSYQIAKSYFHLAELYEKTGQIDSCEIVYDKALKTMTGNSSGQEIYDVSYETVLIEILIGRGAFLSNQGKLEESYANLIQCINNIERLSQINTSEYTRFIIAEHSIRAFKLAVYNALELFNQTGKQLYLDQALDYSLEGKSLSLYWLSQKDYIYPVSGISLDKLEKLQSLREGLNSWMDSKDIWDIKKSEIDTLSLRNTERVLAEYEKLEREIKDNYDLIKEQSGEIKPSQNLIPSRYKNETYLGYYDLDSLLVVFGVNSKERFHNLIRINQDDRQIIEKYKMLLSRKRSGVYSTSEVKEFQDISNQVYELIFKPVEGFIMSRNIAVHTDGCLLSLPFESLVTDINNHGQSIRFKNLEYLLDKYRIRYVATPFITKGERKNNRRRRTLLLTCGNENEDQYFSRESQHIHKFLKYVDIIDLDSIYPDFRSGLIKYQNIHISSHFVSKDADYMHSGLSCSGKDGEVILPFKDILYSNVNQADIFLNSCESGSGPINHGEGLMSLSLAYTMAGARSVIQHYWLAPDRAASEIAVNYYRFRRWLNPEKALWSAKKKYLKHSNTGHDHPYYWAGLVYFGHWQGLNIRLVFILGGLVLVLLVGLLVWRRL
jgi:CHAT domain-containing protein